MEAVEAVARVHDSGCDEFGGGGREPAAGERIALAILGLGDADELEIELNLVPAGEGSEDAVVVGGPELRDEVGFAATG